MIALFVIEFFDFFGGGLGCAGYDLFEYAADAEVLLDSLEKLLLFEGVAPAGWRLVLLDLTP